jgi:flagellar basal body rod protein FlgG
MGLEGLAAAARALQKGIDVAAYNGANQNSGGHKAEQFILRTGNYVSSGVAQRATPVRGSERTSQLARGAGKGRLHESPEQGAFRETGVPENCAIDGSGHFVVGNVDQLLGADPEKLHPLHPDVTVDEVPGHIINALTQVGGQSNANADFTAAQLYTALGDAGNNGGPNKPAVAPLLVLPVKAQADRGDAFGASRLAAPNQASGNGTLRTVLTKFGDFEWSSEVPFITGGNAFADGVDRRSTFSWLQTMDGGIVCGWPNLNLHHPTNKTPQYKNGHMDVAGQTAHQVADRADVDALGGLPGGHAVIGAVGFDKIGFKAVPCTSANMCFFRIPDLRKYEPIEITAEGAVIGQNGNDRVELGRIAIAKVSAPQNLKKIAGSRLLYSEPAGDLLVGEQAVADGIGNVVSGVTELSNVDLAEQAILLVACSTNYGWVLNAVSKGVTLFERVGDIIR